MSDVSKRILEIMERQKISYGELSKRTGIPKSTLQRYATGVTDSIYLDKVQLIAQALNVTPAYLMGWEYETEQVPFTSIEELQELDREGYINVIKKAKAVKLSPKDIETIIEMVRRNSQGEN